MDKPEIIIIPAPGVGPSIQLVEALAAFTDSHIEVVGEIGPDPECIEDAALRMIERMKFRPTVPRHLLRDQRHHPTSPKQRGGR